jgi:hypothetical protein
MKKTKIMLKKCLKILIDGISEYDLRDKISKMKYNHAY